MKRLLIFAALILAVVAMATADTEQVSAAAEDDRVVVCLLFDEELIFQGMMDPIALGSGPIGILLEDGDPVPAYNPSSFPILYYALGDDCWHYTWSEAWLAYLERLE